MEIVAAVDGIAARLVFAPLSSTLCLGNICSRIGERAKGSDGVGQRCAGGAHLGYIVWAFPEGVVLPGHTLGEGQPVRHLARDRSRFHR